MIGLLCTRKSWCRPGCAPLIALTGGTVYCHLLIASGAPSDGGIATMPVLCPRLIYINWPAVQLLDVPQCATRSRNVNLMFCVENCEKSGGCIVGLVRWVYCCYCVNWSVLIVVRYLWYWYLYDDMVLVCIRLHAIFMSCDCIMKCIFVWTQVVNKLLLPMFCGILFLVLQHVRQSAWYVHV